MTKEEVIRRMTDADKAVAAVRERPKTIKLTARLRVKPAGARVLIKPIPEDEFVGKERRIIKPDVARNKPLIGQIVAIGEGQSWDSDYTGKWPPYQVGEIVFYGRYAGYEIPIEEEPEELWPRIVGVGEILGTITGGF